MEKRYIEERKFRIIDYNKPIKITEEILKQIKIGDIINSGFEDAYYSSDSSCESHFYLEIIEERLETDEELEKRIKEENQRKEITKKNRYEYYLKLKKEFEE